MVNRRILRLYRLMISVLMLACPGSAWSQQPLTLEQCRELALSNNKQLKASKIGVEMARSNEKAAKTRNLPRVTGVAGYELFSREVSILNASQKYTLNNLGTNSIGQMGNDLTGVLQNMAQQGLISPEIAQRLGGRIQEFTTPLAKTVDNAGGKVVDAFRTDTRNIFAANIAVTQPIYMGGAIKASTEMARIATEMAGNNVDNVRQSTLYAVDNAYWLAVSLKNKQRLAQEFLNLVKKLDDDVHKMINEGVATRADGLKVDVAVNNAEMTLTQVDNGVSLAKMLLCQLCGLPLNGNQPLADDESSELSGLFIDNVNVSDSTYSSRPEVRMLQNTVELSQQASKLVQAVYKPHVALTGGFTFSNPNVFNGFDKWFDGVWNIGVLVHIPIWNWGEARYRYDATRAATRIAQMELSDIQEKISLQVEQSKFKVAEAQKRVVTARKNLSSADENLRCANVGFKEGVMTVTDVMAAQTAWQKAQTQKLDAEIDLRLAKLSLQKALGNI